MFGYKRHSTKHNPYLYRLSNALQLEVKKFEWRCVVGVIFCANPTVERTCWSLKVGLLEFAFHPSPEYYISEFTDIRRGVFLLGSLVPSSPVTGQNQRCRCAHFFKLQPRVRCPALP